MFTCEICGYETNYKHNYDRHKDSQKHRKTLLNFDSSKKQCQCGKIFKHATSYYRHRKLACVSGECPEFDDEQRFGFDESKQRLAFEVEKLKMEMMYKDKIAQKEIEKMEYKNEKVELEKEKLELQKNFSVHQGQDQVHQTIQQSGLNINGGNNQIISKKNNLNLHFDRMIDLDTFTENYQTEYPLTYEETKILLENYHHSGIKSYGMGLFTFLKRNCSRQMKEILGEEPDVQMMPFVVSDGGLRRHFEKTTEGWKYINTTEKIKKLVIISNDQIYKYHKEFIPMSAYEKQIITNCLLRKADYHTVELMIEKKKKVDGQEPSKMLTNLDSQEIEI